MAAHDRNVSAMAHVPPLRLLFVCTANVCRSPAAEAIARHRGAEAGVDIEVRSVGIESEVRVVHPTIVRLLHEAGIEAPKRQSESLTGEHALASDLIVTMTGAHAIEVARRHRTVLARTFTIDHLWQLLSANAAIGDDRAAMLRVLEGTPRFYPSQPGTIDIPDPVQGPEQAFADTIEQLDLRITAIVDAFAAASRSETRPTQLDADGEPSS